LGTSSTQFGKKVLCRHEVGLEIFLSEEGQILYKANYRNQDTFLEDNKSDLKINENLVCIKTMLFQQVRPCE
jgi:hypothetical protein